MEEEFWWQRLADRNRDSPLRGRIQFEKVLVEVGSPGKKGAVKTRREFS